jgi:Zn-finger domain-containing protein
VKNNYNSTVEMNCLVCAGREFDKSATTAICRNCKNSYTIERSQQDNRAEINATINNVKKEVVNDIKADLQKMLKKSFGSNFKIK